MILLKYSTIFRKIHHFLLRTFACKFSTGVQSEEGLWSMYRSESSGIRQSKQTIYSLTDECIISKLFALNHSGQWNTILHQSLLMWTLQNFVTKSQNHHHHLSGSIVSSEIHAIGRVGKHTDISIDKFYCSCNSLFGITLVWLTAHSHYLN